MRQGNHHTREVFPHGPRGGCRLAGRDRGDDICVLFDALLQRSFLQQRQIAHPIQVGLGVLDRPPCVGPAGHRSQPAVDTTLFVNATKGVYDKLGYGDLRTKVEALLK